MNHKFFGIVMLIFGIYLVLINPILSILIHVVFDVRNPISFPSFNALIAVSEGFWWWLTILVAGAGVVLIKYGRRNLLDVQA